MEVVYSLSCNFAHRHFLQFSAIFPTQGRSYLQLQLPAWRPGRYELGNFSKNIRGWKAHTLDGKELKFYKLNKDLWRVSCEACEAIVISYQYYAAELNAGSTFLSEEMLYVNPVNCFFYDEECMESTYIVRLDLPKNYKIACGLNRTEDGALIAKSFDELADAPWIASDTLQSFHYDVRDTRFYVHLQGNVKLDYERFLSDCRAFTETHFAIFDSIPCAEYHFLFHFVPYFLRHGVEHSNSTVIAMGPAAEFQQDSLYKDLLGISCHELFHTWNIKSIRPIEMMPYDFTKENYTRLGYVAEGVTTYYGDYLLWCSGSFNDLDWYDVLTEHIQTHLDNPGRFNHSVADSSFDTWLDGYVAGIPWRKVSIYNEGFLIAFICDALISAYSNGVSSLDDVMHALYQRFGKTGKGYSEADYVNVLIEFGGNRMGSLAESLVNGTDDYRPWLEEALAYFGLSIQEYQASKFAEAYLGLQLDEGNGKWVVNAVVEDGPADLAGIWIGDEIIAVNGIAPYKNIHHLIKMQNQEATFTILRKHKVIYCQVTWNDPVWCRKYKVVFNDGASETERLNHQHWKSRLS